MMQAKVWHEKQDRLSRLAVALWTEEEGKEFTNILNPWKCRFVVLMI
jgi:hypothetical protein